MPAPTFDPSLLSRVNLKSLGPDGTTVVGPDGRTYRIAPHYKDNTFYGESGDVSVGAPTLDRYAIGVDGDPGAGMDLYDPDGRYNMHAADNSGGMAGNYLLPLAAAAGGYFAFGGAGAGVAASGGGAAATDAAGAVASPVYGGTAEGAALGGASPGVGAGGAGSSWLTGSGAGGAMTTADYVKLGTAAGTMLGGAAASKPGGNQYVPTGMAGADSRWQGASQGAYDLASGAAGMARPAYDKSFGQEMGLDYSGYIAGANKAGAAYGQMGDAAMGQVGQYGADADASGAQMRRMYDASGRVLQTAFDPQEALYSRTVQRTQDQIRQGQAARGLGNSEAGMMEEAGAMSNFNIDWQNAQLARQATGIQAASGATGAGVHAGQMAGADRSAALTAGAAGAGYYGQSGQVPLSAYEYAAGGPGRAADHLVGGYGGVQQAYGNAAAGAIPYMHEGNGATQQSWDNTYKTNRDMVSGMSQLGGAVGPSVGGWFSGGQQGYGTQQQQYNPWTGKPSTDIAYG